MDVDLGVRPRCSFAGQAHPLGFHEVFRVVAPRCHAQAFSRSL